MKTLQDVAKVYKQSAGKALYPGVPYSKYKTGTSKAFKTGNLLTKFVQSPNNQPNTIGKKVQGGYEFELEIAPKGAEYGKFVHYGTYKMGARPFGEIGFNDTQFRDALDELLLEETDDLVMETMDGMDSLFKRAGFSVK